ncbi:MAG TPA: hypothetical protein EYG18_02125 [Micavibrio sp.]|nr:hypothetical protein [Micavibrio sp.]HIL28045.1 hypothetical protein [Micavibrio sp.]
MSVEKNTDTLRSIVKITPLGVAEHQIMTAIDLLRSKNYICCYTLAACAYQICDDIHRKVLDGTNETMHNKIKSAGDELEDQTYTGEQLITFHRRHFNNLKHYDVNFQHTLYDAETCHSMIALAIFEFGGVAASGQTDAMQSFLAEECDRSCPLSYLYDRT